MLLDRVYLKKHRIKFWRKFDGVYIVFQYPADPHASVMLRVELGIIYRDPYRSLWIFVPSDKSVSGHSAAPTRAEAIEALCCFEGFKR